MIPRARHCTRYILQTLTHCINSFKPHNTLQDKNYSHPHFTQQKRKSRSTYTKYLAKGHKTHDRATIWTPVVWCKSLYPWAKNSISKSLKSICKTEIMAVNHKGQCDDSCKAASPKARTQWTLFLPTLFPHEQSEDCCNYSVFGPKWWCHEFTSKEGPSLIQTIINNVHEYALRDT